MSSIPSTESILLAIHQSLGGKGYQTVRKNKFINVQDSIESHYSMSNEILESIFNALDMDELAQKDAFGNLEGFAKAYKEVGLNTWTFAADQRQILWMLLGYFYIPVLARHVAFWSLEEVLDKGMPGGRFWYLPEQCEVDGEPSVYLPIAQVVDWLLDLLGMPLEKFADERSDSTYGEHEGLRRSLYNWRKATTLKPDSVHKYFSGDTVLDFRGAFILDDKATSAEQFSHALDFVERKGLTAEKLRLEIPITQPGCLEDILAGCVNEDVQMRFVECLAERYAAPSNQVIRQRLLLARMVQDGYVRMLNFLCPGVERQCGDYRKNKLLQLINIYKFIYNLTVEAWKNCAEQGEDAENVWFESRLSDWDKEGLYLSILPSRRETSNLELANLLTRRFYEMKEGEKLEDHIGYDEQSLALITMRNINRTIEFLDGLKSIESLGKRVKMKAPEPIFQKEERYWVLAQVAGNKLLRPRAKKAALQRLRELSSSPAETVQPHLIELSSYLNDASQIKKKGVQAKVQSLLAEAECSEGYELWRAAILQYKAKHLLACNDLKGAAKLFKAALEASLERNYGPLRGELARDCFAVELANKKLTVNNHEKYYREMLWGGVLDVNEQIPPIEEVARKMNSYFWDSLYKTYHGVPVIMPRSMEIFQGMVGDLIELFAKADPVGWKEWIKDNQKYLKSSLPDVEGNSVLMLLVKMRTDFWKGLPLLQQMVPPELSADLHRLENMLEHWRQFLKQLVELTPKQLNIPDLKGQTPLMLVAEDGDAELVQAMLQAGADPDIQDWQGMTALHSAVKSYVDGCVDALLDFPCSLDKLTVDGRSPLHTASWSANMHAVGRLLKMAPNLAWQRDEYGLTSLELVESLIENPAALKALAEERKQIGRNAISKQQLREVARLLEEADLSKNVQ
jgi:hypothetical protein